MAKYSVGQSVYLMYRQQDNGLYNVHDGMLAVQRVSVDDLGYHYSLMDSNEDIIDWCREEDVCGNYLDAISECVQRNLLEG